VGKGFEGLDANLLPVRAWRRRARSPEGLVGSVNTRTPKREV
jgi:hypothetical protein